MTVKELREHLEQYKNTDMDEATVLIFDSTFNNNPVNSKIIKIEPYAACKRLAISVKSLPDIILR